MNKKENKISKEIKINKKLARRNYSNQTGITLIALVVTIIVPYDKNMKRFNIKGFLYFGYIRRWVKSLSFFNS